VYATRRRTSALQPIDSKALARMLFQPALLLADWERISVESMMTRKNV